MNKKRVLYDAKSFRDIRDLVQNTARTYPDNIAFIIKEKKGEFL